MAAAGRWPESPYPARWAPGRIGGVQILDNPAWAALTGPQAGFAERHGRSARFPTDVSPFAALADPADPAAWRDLAELAGSGAEPLLAAPGLTERQTGWSYVGGAPGVQLVGTG